MYFINKDTDIDKCVHNPIGRICLRHDKILTFEPNNGETKTNVDILKADTKIFLEWTKGGKLPLISDNREIKELGAEERIYMQENLDKFCSKFALIVNDGLSSYFFNILKLFTKPNVKMKAFKNIDKALEWLKVD